MKNVYFYTHDDSLEWVIPVHRIAKLYAKIMADQAGTVESGLWHEEFYRAHAYGNANPEKVLEIVRNKCGWDEIAPYARLNEPEQNGFLEYEWRKGEFYHEESEVSAA